MRTTFAIISILILTGCARAPRPAATVPPGATTPPGIATPEAARAATCASCPVTLGNQASSAFGVPNGQQPNGCKTGISNGSPLPDPNCTPGAENPTVTLDVLRNPAFRTGCIRNCATTEQQKHVTYGWYSLTSPPDNTGPDQTCELDHLVPLELGGADTLDNIWPQCGPDGVSLNDRYFKQKDLVENYLTAQVKSGAMDLETARHQIATDWTPFLADAKQYCAAHSCL
jgi:hypothetical protein